MTTSNHMFTGAAIALIVRQPLLAVPLAYASHFVLDALPHHGRPDDMTIGQALQHRTTWILESANIIGVPLLAYMLWGQSIWVYVAAVAAMSPDLVWLYWHYYYERNGVTPPARIFTQFHRWIQWCERPWGIVIEVIFLAIGVTVVSDLI